MRDRARPVQPSRRSSCVFGSIGSTKGALRSGGGRLLRTLKRTISPVVSFRRDPLDRRYPGAIDGQYRPLADLARAARNVALSPCSSVRRARKAPPENVFRRRSTVTLERRTPIEVPPQPPAATAAIPVPHVERRSRRCVTRRCRSRNVNCSRRICTNSRAIIRKAPPIRSRFRSRAFNRRRSRRKTSSSRPHRRQLPAAPVSVPTVAPIAVACQRLRQPSSPRRPRLRAPSAAPSPKPPAPTASPSSQAGHPGARRAKRTPDGRRRRGSRQFGADNPRRPARPHVPRSRRRRESGVRAPTPNECGGRLQDPRNRARSPGPKGLVRPGPIPGAGQQKAAHAAADRDTPDAEPATGAGRNASRVGGSEHQRPSCAACYRTIRCPDDEELRRACLRLPAALEPTPPPEVLAQTKYIYKSRGGSSEGQVVMWVTSTHKAGPTTMCTGWLVRYPLIRDTAQRLRFPPTEPRSVSAARRTPAYCRR